MASGLRLLVRKRRVVSRSREACTSPWTRPRRENGCMKVLKGSHLLGRIDHVVPGEQAGADMERVREAMKRLELVTLRNAAGRRAVLSRQSPACSDRNESENPRWGMICCYNARHNDPYKESQHPRYTPLKKVDDSAIKSRRREAILRRRFKRRLAPRSGRLRRTRVEQKAANHDLSMELNHLFTLPRDRAVGIGCIGSGFIMTECHLEAYRASKLNVVAIASRTPARAHEAARRHGIGAVYQSYHELLQDRRVEVVDIAVPPDALLGVIQDVVEQKIGGADHLRGILCRNR